MSAVAVAMRMFGLALGFVSIFLCCVGIGFVGIALARDIFAMADEIEASS